MTVKTRYALSLTAGSSATCMAALPHHLGEKAIPYSGIGFCESDSAIVESRTELITDSLNRTSHPFRRNVEPAAPQAQPLAGFAKDEVSWLRLAGAGNPCQAVGALRAGLPAASAERFARLYLHTHAMAAVACFPLSVFVDQEHWPTISSIRTLGAHSVSSGATVSRNAGFVRPGSKPPCLITFSRAPPLLFSITRTTQESATGQRNNPPRKVALHALRPHVGELWRTSGYSGRTHIRRPVTLAGVSRYGLHPQFRSYVRSAAHAPGVESVAQ